MCIRDRYYEFWLETMTCRLVCCSLVTVISIVGVRSVPGDVSIVDVCSVRGDESLFCFLSLSNGDLMTFICYLSTIGNSRTAVFDNLQL